MYIDRQTTTIEQFFSSVCSMSITGILFVILPLSQWMSSGNFTIRDDQFLNIHVTPPPPIPEFETLKEEEIVEEDVELKKNLQQISLDQIKLVLNAGDGGMSSMGVSVQAFDIVDNFDDMVFEISDLDERPNPLVRILPVYPPKLKSIGVEGKAWIVFIVDERGSVHNARIEKSDHKDFSESSLKAIKQWKFEPGKKGGSAVKTRIRIPLSFQINR